jgi:hypothetical protein
MSNTYNQFGAGSILRNTKTDMDYGALVNYLPNNRILVFRIQDRTYPVFSKLSISPLISKVGHINDVEEEGNFKYNVLREHLLKYYNTRNISSNEKSILNDFINATFPLGVPLYRTEIPNEDEHHHSGELQQGCEIHLNTTSDSSVSELDDMVVYLMAKDENGIWIAKASPNAVEDVKFKYLFYSDKDVPRFSGISRYNVVHRKKGEDELDTDGNTWQLFSKIFANVEKNKTDINIDGKYVVVNLSQQCLDIILPIELQKYKFDPKNDCLVLSDEYSTSNDYYNNNDVDDLSKNTLKTTSKSSDTSSNCSSSDDEYISTGGSRRISSFLNMDLDEMIQIGDGNTDIISEDEDIIKIQRNKLMLSRKKRKRKHKKDSQTKSTDIDNIVEESDLDLDDYFDYDFGNDDDYIVSNTSFNTNVYNSNEISFNDDNNNDNNDNNVDEDDDNISIKSTSDYDVAEEIELEDDEEINIVEVAQKVERTGKADEDKVSKLATQKNELLKSKMEKIPPILRENNIIKRKILFEINQLIDLQNKALQYDINTIKQPLADQYLNGDFRNKHLIPIVVASKRIYTDNRKGAATEDSYNTDYHHIINDIYKEIDNISYIINPQKRVGSDQDKLLINLINELQPYTTPTNSNIGHLIRIGDNVSQNNIGYNSLETIAIRHCDKPMSCQSFEAITDDIDYNVFLGPVCRVLPVEKQNLISQDGVDETIGHLPVNKPYNPIRHGEQLNIIGFVRMPLNLQMKSKCSNSIMFDEIHNFDNANLVKVVNLDSSVWLEDNIQNRVHTLENPEHIIFYYFPQDDSIIDKDKFDNALRSLLPTLDDIIDTYQTKIAQTSNITDISPLLQYFGYDPYNLDITHFNRINDIQETHKTSLLEKSEEITKQFEKKQNTSESDKKETLSNLSISNQLINELESLYNKKYTDFGKTIDTDERRMEWASNQSDNGLYLHYYLLSEYYNKLDLDNIINELDVLLVSKEAQSEILETKHNELLANTQLSESTSCEVKTLGKPRVVRYATIEALEEDNNKSIVDGTGENIIPGDIAITKILNKHTNRLEPAVFERQELGNDEMWVRVSRSKIQDIIDAEKSRCTEINKLDPSTSECTYDITEFKCSPNSITLNELELAEHMESINVIKDDILHMKHIKKTQSILEREVRQYRNNISRNNDIDTRYKKYILEKEKQLDKAIEESIYVRKECVHFQATSTFHSSPNLDLLEKYNMAGTIRKRFINLEKTYIVDKINPATDDNWAECYICNQHLLCNHFMLGVEQIITDGFVNLELISSIFGIEKNKSFICRICGLHIMNKDTEDISAFVRVVGAEGKRIVGREVMDVEIDKQDPLGDYMKEIELDDVNQFKITLYTNLKYLCGLKNKMTVDDDRTMITFLKSYDFIEKEQFIQGLLARKIDTKVIFPLADMESKRYLACDIASKFLIILQTSSTSYIVKNNYCDTNYFGYPIVPDETQENGIKLMLCILKQVGTNLAFKKYLENTDKIKDIFLKRLSLMTKNGNIQTLLENALDEKSNLIDNIVQFNDHYTNAWKSFRPPLINAPINWQPEKILVDDEIASATSRTIRKMMLVGHQNNEYNSKLFIHGINNVILKQGIENIAMRDSISNSCCIEPINDSYDYLNFLKKDDDEISSYVKQLERTSKHLKRLESMIDISWVHLETIMYAKPSSKIHMLHFNMTPEEIKDLHITYIDSGINQGKKHLYDIYGRCILSNQLKNTIENKSYNIVDFNKLTHKIANANIIGIPPIEEINIDDSNYIVNKFNELKKISHTSSDIIQIIEDVLDLVHRIENKEKDIGNTSLLMWNNINSKIGMEIDNLSNKLSNNPKDKKMLSDGLYKLGDYINIYNDMLDTTKDEDDSSNYRYKNKEIEIKRSFLHLSYSVSLIKNGKIASLRNKDEMRSKYQYLFPFREDIKLFQNVFDLIEPYLTVYKYITGIKGHKYIRPENSSIILHYLFVSSLSHILDKYSDNIKDIKVSSIIDEEDTVEKPVIFSDDEDDIISPSSFVNKKNDDILSSDDSENELEDENQIGGSEKIKSIDKDRSSNLNKITQFLQLFIVSIITKDKLYNILTYDYVKKTVAQENESQIRKNLNTFKFLEQDENLTEEYRLLILQMRQGIKGYKDLPDIVAHLGLENVVDQTEDDNDDGENFIENEGEDNEERQNMYDSEAEYDQLMANVYDDGDSDAPDDGFFV